jgi:hypothetical protein
MNEIERENVQELSDFSWIAYQACKAGAITTQQYFNIREAKRVQLCVEIDLD